MTKPNGWLILSRKLFDSDPDWNEVREFSRFEAWIDVIQMTAYADYKKTIGASVTELKRGEVLLSVRFLARRWSWSNGRVTRWLKTSTATERLRVQKQTQDGYIYLLPNYDTYQIPWNTNEYTNGTVDETNPVQQRNTNGYKENTVKKKKEEKGPAESPLPACLDTEEVRSALSDYLQHRKEKNSKMTPTAQRQMIRAFESWGSTARVVAALRFTTMKGWTGVKEPGPGEEFYPGNGASEASARSYDEIEWERRGGAGKRCSDGRYTLHQVGTYGTWEDYAAELGALGKAAPARQQPTLDTPSVALASAHALLSQVPH